MDPIIGGALISGGLGLVGGGLNTIGQMKANAQQIKMMRWQMKWQEKMRSTQYQTAIADMKAAGLNPALAYQQGGAGTPSGSMADQGNEMSGLGGGLASAGGIVSQIGMQRAQRENIQAQTANTDAATRQTLLESRLRVAQLAADLAGKRLGNSAEAKRQEPFGLYHYQAKQAEYDAEHGRMDNTVFANVAQTMILQAAADLKSTNVNARAAGANARLAELGIPGAINEANAEGSLWKRKFAPYLGDAKSVAGLLSSLSMPFAVRGLGSKFGRAAVQELRRTQRIR